MKRKNKLYLIASIFMVLFVSLLPEVSFAEEGSGFGAIGTSIGNNVTGMTTGAKKILYLIGFVMVGAGAIGIANAKKTNQPLGMFIPVVIVGFILLSLPTFISSGSATLFGSDKSKVSEIMTSGG